MIVTEETNPSDAVFELNRIEKIIAKNQPREFTVGEPMEETQTK